MDRLLFIWVVIFDILEFDYEIKECQNGQMLIFSYYNRALLNGKYLN